MAINIKFDLVGNPEPPTIILANKNGNKLGQLNINTDSIELSDKFNEASEISFTINKYINGKLAPLWDKIIDFKLVYCKEWDVWFEIKVELDEETKTVKTVFCTQLGQAELSQIMLYDIEINTENDIERDDYKISILYDGENQDGSILHRILEKAPHYSIAYVDPTIAKIQRTFSFDDISIYDALQEIAEEIGCLFVFNSNSNEEGKIQRTISVYDLQQNCNDCEHRGEFTDSCPKCNSTNITNGYGEDTLIFVTSDELASDGIQLVTDTDSVKNCFKLEAGDDLMTATIRNCNPNGTDYIWYLSNTVKEDMSEELVDKLESYDELYEQYYKEHVSNIDSELLDNYNALIHKYSCLSTTVENLTISSHGTGGSFSCTYGKSLVQDGNSIGVEEEFTASSVISIDVLTSAIIGNYVVLGSGIYYIPIDAEFSSSSSTTNYVTTYRLKVDKAEKIEELYDFDNLQKISTQIIGYPALMEAYYNTTDFELYLKSELMPSVEMSDTNAQEQAALLTSSSLSSVAVADITVASLATVDSAVLSMAKTIVRPTYKIEINSSEMYDEGNSRIWSGDFVVTSYSDEEDVATSNVISIEINDDLESFIEQKLDRALNKENTDDLSISGLFEKECEDFCKELKKYALNPLISLHDACQACIDILIEQGVGNGESWSDTEEGSDGNLYEKLYVPYYDKLAAIESEIKVREDDISVIVGVYDANGNLVTEGIQTHIEKCKNEIQDTLNFENYLGSELWLEFCTYRREDKYSNENYISDGLNNAELFKRALEFYEVAENEIYKSSELQHSISATLNNLLAIQKFKPLVDSFSVGNWIRVQVDDNIYKLRLLKYDIDYSDFNIIQVDFSDVIKIKNGTTDIQDVLSQASSMATSYDSVKKQANQGEEAKATVEQWISGGLNSAYVQIQSNDSEDITLTKNGLLCRSYDDVTGTYLPEQLKLTHNIMAYTDDDWKSVRQAIGKHRYVFYDKNENEFVNKIGYGINADFVTAGVVSGSQIIGGDIYSDNYSKTGLTGSYLNLRDGTFSFGGGSLRFEGGKLTISSPDIPTTDTITQINEEYLKTTSVYAENLQVGSANIVGELTASQINTTGLIAENISATTIEGKSLIGGEIFIGDENGTYAQITPDGELKCNSGKISIFEFDEDSFIAAYNEIIDYKFSQSDFLITIRDSSYDIVAGIYATTETEVAGSGYIGIEASNVVYIKADEIVNIGGYSSRNNNIADFNISEKRLDLYGDLYVENINYSNSLNNSSDKRLKNDLGDISESEAFNILNNLDIKKFTYKSDEDNKIRYGIYAQDLRDILKNLDIGYVSALSIYNPNTKEYITDLNHSEDDVVYGVDYMQFIPLLIKAYQNLLNKIKELES